MGQEYNIVSLDCRSFSNKRVALDNNVLYWTFYGANIDFNERQSSYSTFIEKLLDNNAVLVTTATTLNEFFHLVEKNELALYNYANGLNLSKKDFRKVNGIRTRLQSFFKTLYTQIQQVVTIEPFDISNEFIADYLDNFSDNRLDCLDYALLLYCKQNDIDYIITDDRDFTGYDTGCNILTVK